MMRSRKIIFLACIAVVAMTAHGQDAAAPPVRSAMVNTQRQGGEFLVQGSVAPAWHVPAAAPTAAAAVTKEPGKQAAALPMMRRISSAEWRDRIDRLTEDIEAKRRELEEAKSALVVSVNEERRLAEEQVRAAERRVQELRQEAERAAAVAAAMKPAAAPVAAAITAVQGAAAPATPAAAPVPAPSWPTFQLRRADRTIAAAMTRWAEEARYQLLWEASDEPASFEDSYVMSFPDAVDRVVRALRVAGKDLTMCEYTNRVVRIVPRSNTCQINTAANKALTQGETQ